MDVVLSARTSRDSASATDMKSPALVDRDTALISPTMGWKVYGP